MNHKRTLSLIILLLSLAAFVASASAQAGSGPTGPDPVIIPGDGTLMVRKVVVGAVPAADWEFTGSFSFTLPAAGGEITIYASEGTYTVTETAVSGYSAAVSCTNGASGTSSVTVALPADTTITCTFTNTAGGGSSTASLYLSPTAAGTVGGIAVATADILYRDGPAGTWSMYFDGSDVSVTKAIQAFAHLPNGDLLLVFKANQPTPAGTFTAWDVARFHPTAPLGSDPTQGSFSWYIDGSDVGLTTSGEKIDALDALPDGRVLVSTTGAMAVPKPGGGTLKSQDEDLTALSLTSLGDTTAGTWALYFNGTAVSGMGAEDLAGAHVDAATGDVYAAILGAFNIGGVSGNGKDVIKLHPTGGGAYTVTMYWRGPDNGFNLNVGGLELP